MIKFTRLSCLSSVFIIFSVLLVKMEAGIELPANVTIPALIGFGDSIIDPGNNNNLLTVGKCNFPPYGQDFPHAQPTGRFSNGRIPTDLIAEELGLKRYLPAYTDPDLNPEELLTGVSFASGGSGYDPLTPTLVSVLPLWEQLNMFKEYRGKLKAMVGEEKSEEIISKSVYLVVAGSNDISNT